MAKGYQCHHAVDRRKVVPKKRRDELTLDYLGQNYIAETKHDGCQAIIFLTRNGGVQVQSRTGEVYVGPMPAAYQLAALLRPTTALWGDVVVFAEAWWPGRDEFPKISGAYRRGEPNDQLMLIVFDMVLKSEFDAGQTDVGFVDRKARYLPAFDNLLPGDFPLVDRPVSAEPGTYGDPQELANRYVNAGGFDGLMLKKPDGGWVKDKASDALIKIKAEVSLDLRVVDVMTGVGGKTGRPVYTITVEYKGVRSDVGSGMPHDLASVPKVGDIVEILCMEVNKDGHLREPRYKGIRFDKTQPDS